MEEPAEILMTTPESLEVMLISPRCPTQRLFGDLRMVIIDEIHAHRRHRPRRAPDVGDRAARVVQPERHPARRAVGHRGQPDRDPRAGCKAVVEARRRVVIDPPEGSRLRARSRSRAARDHRWSSPRTPAHERSGKKSLFFCQSRALTEAVAETHAGQGSRRFRPPQLCLPARSATTAEDRFHHGTTPASSARRPWSWASTWAISTSSSRPTRRAPCRRSCSAWAGPAAARGQIANTTFLCESPEDVLQAVAHRRAGARRLGRVGARAGPLLARPRPPAPGP